MRFTKHDSGKLKRVGNSWRKPTGKKNRTRLGWRGHKPMPSEGFKRSAALRFRIAGKIPVRVFAPKEVDALSDSNIVIIGASVGKLKRKAIADKCAAKNIKMVNYERIVENSEKTGQ